MVQEILKCCITKFTNVINSGKERQYGKQQYVCYKVN
uniref:Uncharacterized protein n=1 Tax=Arundo donax TaxID=35708 RepID=A0A0A8ZM33_ARUDO